MKIAIFDPYVGRFTQSMIDWWRAHGHEVIRDTYYDPKLVQWADVSWFFTTDNNIKSATNPGEAILADTNNPFPWALKDMDLTNKRIIVQPIDIECWFGHHNGVDWSCVDDVVFIAPHIQKMVEKDIDFVASNTRVHCIPMGVDIDKFDFVDKPIGKKIAWVCEKWPTKGIDYMLQIMALLPKDWELHTIGGWNDRHVWEKAYQEDFIKRHNIKFFDYEWVEDQNDWLADKDFILSTSKKEAFGMNIAEGMSKGLIPIIHRFYGCDDLWNINVWDTVDEAVNILLDIPDSINREVFRQYLKDKGYTIDAMMQKIEEVIHASV